ncbi:unnamed protein product [Polarella glacialis]|uniref:Uncharacterized protein n=1 Tax=Polarella glacialis TaxID=89957 RepID=A0A813E8K8_POLGL|nr:unnamed protein product [Polarella glacialis]CAE8597447.1 unnamed protein product [Polarella glacialis]CAE8703053.1 unnamed protein product [Polarella glacialis]CAE8717584.1 unnamed protein product [Polarella glacialis]|mmetsp:Transcript_80601/g.145520  ORF Transcript_80601/g.145520 Transcript_80601/m.145520 type:complete len:123 (+) Transcript_80601:76-444(+)
MGLGMSSACSNCRDRVTLEVWEMPYESEADQEFMVEACDHEKREPFREEETTTEALGTSGRSLGRPRPLSSTQGKGALRTSTPAQGTRHHASMQVRVISTSCLEGSPARQCGDISSNVSEAV